MRYHFTFTRMSTIKKKKIISVGRYMEVLEPSSIAGWNIKRWSHFGKQFDAYVQGQEGQRWGDTPRPRKGAVAALCWSSREEIPHRQGKRNPSKTVSVARGHQRADTLTPYSQKTSQSNHTRTTYLSNSMKLSHACGARPHGGEVWQNWVPPGFFILVTAFFIPGR